MYTIAITCGTSSLKGAIASRDEKDSVPSGEFVEAFMKRKMEVDDVGAELTALYKLWNDEGVPEDESEIYFLVSDTARGEFVGKLLTEYINKNTDAKAEYIVVKNLTPTSDERFYRNGLPTLVKEVARVLMDKGIKRNRYAILLPIGGFKQSSTFAVLTAQVLGIPSYFLLSASASLGKIPPLPVSLDKEWAQREDIHHILMVLEEGVEKKQYDDWIKALSEEDRIKLKPFVEIEHIDRESYVSLSAMGMVLLYTIKRQTEVVLRPRPGEFHFQSSKSEEHSKVLINKYRIPERLEKIPFITFVRVAKYSEHQKQRKPKVTAKSNGHFSIELALGADGILTLDVETTAETPEEIEKAEKLLKEYLAELF